MLATDNFNRANGPVGSDWTLIVGFGTPQVDGNRFRSEVNWGGNMQARWINPATATAGSFSQVTCDIATGASMLGPWVGNSGTATNWVLDDGYWLVRFSFGSAFQLNKNGSSVATWPGTAEAEVAVYRLEAVAGAGGSLDIKGYKNGALLGTYNDTSPLTGAYFGITLEANQLYDNFSGGDIADEGGGPPPVTTIPQRRRRAYHLGR